MSEKNEALRFNISFPKSNFQILRVTHSGEFIWNENADQMIRDPVFTEANPAIIHVVRALRQAEIIRQENERLREALAWAYNLRHLRGHSDPVVIPERFAPLIEAALRRVET